MTLVTMKQADFDSMSDERLGWVCVEWALVSIRGKDPATKRQVIASLNKSQQALCMFRVFYDHAKNSASEYYCWTSYLLETPGYWSGVTGGVRYFGDENMIQLLEDTRRLIEERKHRLNKPMTSASFKDLEEERELSRMIDGLYETFLVIAPDSLKRISTFIRCNPHHFVTLEE